MIKVCGAGFCYDKLVFSRNSLQEWQLWDGFRELPTWVDCLRKARVRGGEVGRKSAALIYFCISQQNCITSCQRLTSEDVGDIADLHIRTRPMPTASRAWKRRVALFTE